ncbi:MAG: hypothetical protein L0196_03660 [candidate division Zixibacteria bacterium]|nr:hypothetical protein [candidate division Zixibacteria bacterium]
MVQELMTRQVFEETLKRVLIWGMLMNLGIPTGLLLVAYFLTGTGNVLHVAPEALNVTFILFLLVSLADLGVAAWMRYFLLTPSRLSTLAEVRKSPLSGVLLSTTITIYALCLVSAVLGFAYFVLGGQVEKGLLLLVFNLLGYQFLRPRPELVKKLLGFTGGA